MNIYLFKFSFHGLQVLLLRASTLEVENVFERASELSELLEEFCVERDAPGEWPPLFGTRGVASSLWN